jgi:hypothetical protein
VCGFFFCQVDLAFRFAATNFLISLGKLLIGRWGFLFGVASLAACCNMLIKLSVARSTSACSVSYTARFVVLRTSFLYVSPFVCELCSRGGGCRTVRVVLIVAVIGVWSEVRS